MISDLPKEVLKLVSDFIKRNKELLSNKKINQLYDTFYWNWYGDGTYNYYQVKGNPLTIVLKGSGINPLNYTDIIPNCYNAFDNEIEVLRVSNNIKVINTAAYSQCSVANVICAEGLERINADAFYKCTNLSKIVLPKTLKSIEEDAFSECSYLHTIIYRGTKEELSKIRNISGAFADSPEGTVIECSDGVWEL